MQSLWSLPRGSPPRGRGRRSGGVLALAVPGLTPAWAGTTSSPRSTPTGFWAHPRVGGDDLVVISPSSTAKGSPPRGRGRPTTRHIAQPDSGLTPAWAGTTTDDAGHRPPPRAHPRVGGDDVTPRSRLSTAGGSPPRGRGTTHARTRPASAGRAHPRVGGDDRGSEPPDPPDRRLTPAWAGTTHARS